METTENKENQKLDQILNIIKRQEISYASGIWVPSLKREVKFKEINTSQQKRLVKSIIDSPVYNTEFILTLRDILKENCVDTSVVIDELTILDKLVLALGLRIKSVGPTVEIEVTTKDGKNVKHTINLISIYEKIEKDLNINAPIVLTNGMFTVTCDVPTIKTEYALEKELRGKVIDIEIKDASELRKTIGDAFIGEIVKYVSGVTVKSGEDVLDTDWKTLTFEQRISVINTFNTILLKDILKYIDSVRKEVDKVELLKFKFADEDFEKRLTIDGSFFTIS